MKILITPTSFKNDSPALAGLKPLAEELIFNNLNRPLKEDELIRMLEGCRGCIAGLDYFTAEVIKNAPDLKVISRYGAGVDRVDLAAAKAGGITVCNTPGANAQAVADMTVALMLCTARRIPVLDRKTREGLWTRSSGIELYGKNLGILGLGAVGKAVARRGMGFSMKILAYDPYIDREYAKSQGIIAAGFEEVLQEADFLCLHLPLSDETRHIISEKTMALMKPGAVIVNTARGGLIDEDAACQFLKTGHLGGLGLDVYENEPPGNSPLFALENVVVTPHTAAHTAEATAAMAALSVQNLVDVLNGKNCPYVVR
jgi:D-3-phosphoglycerate dehydrogenase